MIIEETREEAVTPVPIEPGTPVANTPTTANSLRALNTELRYYAHDTKTAYAFLAVGSRFVWLPETFVRSRLLWRHAFADNTFISPSVTPFWQDHLGFGVTPQLDFGHPFPHDHIFLWANSATVFRNRSGFLWGSEVSLSRILSPVTAIAVAVGASGATRPSLVADRFNLAANNYKVTGKYRRNIYRPWLFLELVPETNWRRDDGRGPGIHPGLHRPPGNKLRGAPRVVAGTTDRRRKRYRSRDSTTNLSFPEGGGHPRQSWTALMKKPSPGAPCRPGDGLSIETSTGTAAISRSGCFSPIGHPSRRGRPLPPS